MLGDIKQAALRNHDNLAHLQADIDSMSSRQDKNFNELGTAWIEMKCKLQSLEEKVHGKSTVWKTKLGE